MVNKVRVNIAGTPYAIATTDSEKYILGLAKKLDEDITKLLDTNDNLSVTKAAVFCAMDYLDEYRKSTGSAENMRSQIQDYIADAARAKLAEDKALAENAVLRREAAALREQLAKERQRETRREERAARAAAETAQEQPSAPETPAADGRDGGRITTCQNCGDSSYTVLPGSGTAVEETHTVTGTVVLAADRAATKGTHAAIGADILLNGYTLATTDEKGNFSLQLKSGTYALTVRYAYGFSRTLYVVVSDRDLQCGSVPVIGCDWNKDGKIDDQDYYMFKLIFGTHQGQAGYLSYVDMNHDGMINTRDMVFVERCMGLQAGSFAYTPLVIR